MVDATKLSYVQVLSPEVMTMGEETVILANITHYEDMLQAVPEHPQHRTIELLLAEEREKLTRLLCPWACPWTAPDWSEREGGGTFGIGP